MLDSLRLITNRLAINPRFYIDKSFNGEITLTVKTKKELLGKKVYLIKNGIIPTDTLIIEANVGGKIWFDFFYDGIIKENIIGLPRVIVREAPFDLQPPTIIRPTSGSNVPISVYAGFYAENEDKGFGMMYRGWGGFVYNASEGRFSKPIDESLLKLPESNEK